MRNLGWPPLRSSGVLLHPTSLPEGRLGRDAYGFVDWLARAGQAFWQVLPLNPPDAFRSPYASPSAFAGFPGLLARPDAKVSRSALSAFRRRHAYWIDDWAAFTGAGSEAIADQLRFEREWLALRRYASERGVRIIGDLPIYVARDGADVASHPEFFDLSRAAGVPPDYFSETGQLWGNPTYRWAVLRRDRFRWWTERLRRTLRLVDATRLDHFRGFVAFWAVPEGSVTAEHGRWHPGPGLELFEAARSELGSLPLIAEDLGVITPPVHRLRQALGALGMHVLEFGFGASWRSHHPAHHRELSVVYTGTHDHAPVGGWWAGATSSERRLVARALDAAGIDDTDMSWALIELALSSRARVALVQAQDVLGLGEEARMNHPGTTAGNWRWRLDRGQLSDAHADRLRLLSERWGRGVPRRVTSA